MENENPAILPWWEPFSFREGIWYCWNILGSEIFVCRKDKLMFGFCRSLRWDKRDASCSGPCQLEEAPVSQADCKTNVLNGETAALRPCLPEKPFLVNVDGLRLFPGTEVTLELELPPILQLVAENDKPAEPNIIFNFIPFELKAAWCGRSTMEGFLCSSLPAPAFHSKALPHSDDSAAYTQAVIHCRMALLNRTKTILDLKSIPLYAGELAVYEINKKLVSDKLVVDAMESDFRVSVTPIMAKQKTLLAKGNAGFFHGTKIIKNITGF